MNFNKDDLVMAKKDSKFFDRSISGLVRIHRNLGRWHIYTKDYRDYKWKHCYECKKGSRMGYFVEEELELVKHA